MHFKKKTKPHHVPLYHAKNRDIIKGRIWNNFIKEVLMLTCSGATESSPKAQFQAFWGGFFLRHGICFSKALPNNPFDFSFMSMMCDLFVVLHAA